LVELVGTPFAKAYLQEDNSLKTEIRLNVSKTNILRPARSVEVDGYEYDEEDHNEEADDFGDFGLSEDDFSFE
jgi:single-strand DNA-binding protein